MRRETCGALVVLALVCVVSTASAFPSRVVRPTGNKVLVYCDPATLKCDDRVGVTMWTARGLHTDVDARVTAPASVVTLPSEVSEELDAVRRTVSRGAAVLLINELTLGGRVQRNLMARVPVALTARLVERVGDTTARGVECMPALHRERALGWYARLVAIKGVPLPVSGVQPTPPLADGEWLFEEWRDLSVTINGSMPHGAPAAVSVLEQCGFYPQPLASESRRDPPGGGGSRLAGFFSGVDVHVKFGFANSAGADATFGLTTRLRRPFLFSAFGERNQVAVGPRAELRANSLDQDDEDSIVLSVPITYTRTLGDLVVPLTGPAESPEAPWVNAVVFDVGPALEVDKSFGSGNLISDAELGFGLATLGGEHHGLDARPFVGFEAGMGLASGDGRGGMRSGVGSHAAESVRRVKAGIAARYGVEFNGNYLHEIVFDLKFVYRQLYTVEPIGRWVQTERTLNPEDGEMVARETAEDRVVVRTLQGDIGRGSRRYLDAAVRFAFTENWEFVLSYVRGELPPRFVGVDKVEAGFAFRLGDGY